MKSISILFLLLLSTVLLKAQDNVEGEMSQTAKKGFLIVAAGKNYTAMKELATKVATDLGYELDFRLLYPNDKIGLSYSKEECDKDELLEYPSYYPRGRYDDGNFVSIEYTDAYDGFTQGYYIIVVAVGAKGEKGLNQALKHTKSFYKSAYIKYTDIYMGCMH